MKEQTGTAPYPTSSAVMLPATNKQKEILICKKQYLIMATLYLHPHLKSTNGYSNVFIAPQDGKVCSASLCKAELIVTAQTYFM